MKDRAISLGTMLLPGIAEAHAVSARFGEFYSGLLHPLTTLEHLVPWIGLGLLAGLAEPTRARWVMLVFPLATALGVGVGAAVGELPGLQAVNVGSFVVLGLLVAFAPRLRHAVFFSLSGLVGFSHGLANAPDSIGGGALLLYVLGVALAAYCIVTIVAAATTRLTGTAQWGRIAVRAVGSWIVAIGLVFGSFSLVAAG